MFIRYHKIDVLILVMREKPHTTRKMKIKTCINKFFQIILHETKPLKLSFQIEFNCLHSEFYISCMMKKLLLDYFFNLTGQ